MENWLARRALQACSVPRQMNEATQQVLCTYNASSALHAAALPCCCRLQLAVQAHLRNVAGSTVHCHTPHSECISKHQAVCDQRACLVLLCCWCVCHRMLGCKFLGADTAALDRLVATSGHSCSTAMPDPFNIGSITCAHSFTFLSACVFVLQWQA